MTPDERHWIHSIPAEHWERIERLVQRMELDRALQKRFGKPTPYSNIKLERHGAGVGDG